MAGLKQVNNADILNIAGTIKKYGARVEKGDDSTLSTNVDAIKKEESAKKVEKSTGRNSKYSGPLKLYLDEFDISEYNEDIIQFKEFFDHLGSEGMTYETLFARIKKYSETSDNNDITVSKVKSKLYQMNSLNTISLATVRDISFVLGYEMRFKFQPIITDEIFNSDRKLKDL